MDLKSVKIIAVDFDGTLCENKWPEIGTANEELIEYLRDRQKNGDKLILWTCRVDDMLRKAVEWCKEKELVFDAVNENLPEIVENFGSDTRKIFANEYIDDRNTWPLEDGVADVLYLCDGKRCGDTCSGTECKHTSDITYAKNFVKSDNGSYWEKEAGSATKDSDSHEKSNMELWAEREVEIACKHEAPDRKPGEWDYGCACYESALKAFQSLCEDGHSGFSISMTKFILNRSGLIDRVMEEKFPITMPYFPESKPFRVYCEEFLTDRKNGDFDTVGILHVIKPDGERVEINRYFKEGEKDFIEIASCEYEMRRKMYHELLENLKKEQKKDCHGCFGAADNSCKDCMEEEQHESE